MKKSILLMIFAVVLCSFAYADNDTGCTGCAFYEDWDNLNGWTAQGGGGLDASWGVETFMGETSLNCTDGDHYIVHELPDPASDQIVSMEWEIHGNNIPVQPAYYGNNWKIATDNNGLGQIEWRYGTGFAGSDTQTRCDGCGDGFENSDYDYANDVSYVFCYETDGSYGALYVNRSIHYNDSFTGDMDMSNYDYILMRSNSQSDNMMIYYFGYWYGTCDQSPFAIVPPTPTMTTSLDYPTNGTTTSSYSGFINISLTNVNGSANCTLSDGNWSFFSNDNSTYSFWRNNTPAHQNYSIEWYCNDTGGIWSNGSFWFNVENRLTIDIYDELSNQKINDSITFIFRKDDYEYVDVATNGTYILFNETGLPPGFYQITLNGTDYYQRIYHLTVTDDQVQHENFYLLQNNASSLITFYIKNLADQALEDMSVIFTTWINVTDSDAPITHRYTDYAGSMLVNLHYLSRYGITIADPSGDYATKFTEIEPVFSSYTIYLDVNSSQNFTTVWDHVSYDIAIDNSTVNPTETNFSFSVSSDNANIDFFGFYTTINGTLYSTNITTHPSGGIASILLPLNATNNQNFNVNYFIATTNPHFILLPLTYSVLNISAWQGNNSLAVIAPDYKTEFSERLRLLSAHFLAILAVAVFAVLIKRNYAPLIGIPVLIVFAIPPVGWIPVWIVAFESIIIGGFFVAFGDW